jgi:NhaP-type Na+/H+ or K+/H+ antiporter
VTLFLVYGIALLIAVLFSEWSRRTVLSSAVLFLAAGVLVGPKGLGLIHVDARLVSGVSDLALFSILFSDGLKLAFKELRRVWRLPGRALLIGMPFTALFIAGLGRLVLDLSWPEALLVAAILSPTDPVFASAIVGRPEIPGNLRHLLNVESGLNDGIALPFVIAFMALASGHEWRATRDLAEVGGGLILGAAIAAAILIRKLRLFSVARAYEPLLPLALAIIIYASARLLQVNEYLAAFAGGLVLASVSDRARQEFRDVGERLSGLLKLAAVLMLAIAVSELPLPGWRVYVFAVLVLTLSRTIPLLVALTGSALPRDQRLVAAWFGPKGFASMIYGLMVLRSDVQRPDTLFAVVATVVILSIVVHSSTDVPVAQYFARLENETR